MTDGVSLRNVVDSDLPTIFDQQRDPVANHMAGFTRDDPSDREAFMNHWAKILNDEKVTLRTILVAGQVAGHIARFERSGIPEVTYWIGRQYWGRGVASTALTLFLDHNTERPLYARAAKDNLASIRVLEKSGFVLSGQDKGFARARNAEIEEVILTLR